MSRRDRIDPETARRVEDRLHWLLTEHGPESVLRSEAERTTAGSRPTTPVPPRRSRPDPTPAVERASPRSALSSESVPSGRSVPSSRPVRVDRSASTDSGEHTRIADRAPRPVVSGSGGPLTALSAFRRPHLVVIASIVALGLLIAGWAVLRARPVAVAVTPPPVVASGSGAAPPSGRPATAGTPSATAPPVVVHVLGAVRQPGLVSLAAGSRVQDALDAAGGLTSKADAGELNLAQPVNDGQQIVVGTRGKPSGELRGGAGGSTGAGSTGGSTGANGGVPGAGQPVNLNTAGQAQLEELPGVGPVMAGKILAWRTEHGRFSRVEELQEIDGVGPKTYAKLAPLCRV